MSRRNLHKYTNKIFIESGTYIGDGIQDALDSGFKNCFSIEITELFYNISSDRFKNNYNVSIYHNSSVNILGEILKSINEPVTFWLDGHYSCGPTGFDPSYICPLIRELEIISEHYIKNHIIMVDDRRLLQPSSNNGMDGLFNISEKEVLDKLLTINPNYSIKYENGHVENDIIVAYIPS